MAKTIYKEISSNLSQLLGDIDLGKLALPDIQRPFVWKKSKVRDLLDSMYRGFPIGYLMLWSTSDVTSKSIGSDGKQYSPSEFIIDGQQRLTSLYAVMKGKEVLFKDFTRGRIQIAFKPSTGRFDVADAAVQKDPEYLSDITTLWTGQPWEVVNGFVERLRKSDPEALSGEQEGRVREALDRLRSLIDFPFQGILIGHEVDEEQVAEIFLRVNSGGTPLTQADFILTLLSVYRESDRRRLEAFAEAARAIPSDSNPSPYNHLLTPDPDQMLRVAILLGFKRGRLGSMLALLRGADPEGSESLTEADHEKQLDRLTTAIDHSIDLTNWHEYLKALMAAGFRRSTEISSVNNALLVYAIYLIGRHDYNLSHPDLRTTVSRYFFMASLTGRYTGSFETRITQDVQNFTQAKTGDEYLARIKQAIDASLTEDFWSSSLPLELSTSASRGPALFGYAASLILLDARMPPMGTAADGSPKASIPLRDLFDPVLQPKRQPVERHHLFPRAYLERQGVTGTRLVNQVANLAYVEWPDNIEISDKAPSEYWPPIAGEFSKTDLENHALPENWHEMAYDDFLEARRKLIARVIQAGYEQIGAEKVGHETAKLVTGHQFETYLHPDRPYSNELAVRRILRKLEGRVFWYEQHLDRKVLELLTDELVMGSINAVHLLSGPANLNSKSKKQFLRFAAEFAEKNIIAEWRVLAPEEARRMHARVIADDDEVFELPPLNSVLAGTVDSIRESKIPMNTFEESWADATPLDEWQLNN